MNYKVQQVKFKT